MTAPLTPRRLSERPPQGGTRLHGIMGVPDSESGPRFAMVDLVPEPALIGGPLPQILRFEDASTSVAPRQSAAPLAIQLLWAAPDADEGIFAGWDALSPPELTLYPAHPGDTLLVPPNAPFAPGVGSIAFVAGTHPLQSAAVEVSPNVSILPPPSHGLNLFRGHNRRTICLATPGLMIERWKLTSPLILEIEPNHPLYLVNLVQPTALVWNGGLRLLGRLEASIIPASLRQITLVPDGLGYVLIVSTPNLARHAVAPLRAAGYPLADLRAIGIPDNDTGHG